jgi:hypothetical protein
MGCHKIDSPGMRGWLCLPNIYQYGGFTFEWHRYLGPVKLRRDFEPAKREGRTFYSMLDRWTKFSEAEKKRTQVYG